MDERERIRPIDPNERIRRPKPERTGPLRGGTHTLFAPPEPPPGTEVEAEGEGGAPDAVARAVDLGYRVVDDYIRQGQHAARLMARRAYGPEALANDVQDLAARAFQYGAEFFDLWMELLGQAAGGQPLRPSWAPRGPRAAGGPPPGPHAPGGPPPGPRAGGAPPAPRGGRRDSRGVALAVESPLPVEVTVELDAGTAGELRVQDLQSVDGGPALRGLRLDGGDPPRLRLRVPPGQPPGTYCGLVIDAESARPAGTVVVRVLAPASPSGAAA